MRSRTVVAAIVGLLVVAAACVVLATKLRKTPLDRQHVNIVLVIACTFRADQLGIYGSKPDPMPFLSRRAARGTVFERMISAAPWTKPATAALITGRHPATVGMVQMSDELDHRRLGTDIETLAEVMHASGRRTIGGTANPNANARFGFDQGFDAYSEPPPWHKGKFAKIDGRAVVDDALADLAAGPDKPFFLQVLLVDAHLPYALEDASKRWEDNKFSKRIAQYRAMLFALDARLQRLVDGLAAQGHDESDTIFVVVGDHGEGLKYPVSHGNGHGFYLYPSTVHVPLVVWGAGIPGGRRLSALTSGVDIAPTLAGLVGQKLAVTDGKDSSSLWTGGTDRAARTEAYTSTFFKGANRAAIYADDHMCQRVYGENTAEKRVRDKPAFPDACFAWRADPDAEQPLEDAALNQRLDDWHTEQIRLVGATAATDATLDDATREALRGLGYLE